MQESLIEVMQRTSHLFGANLVYVEQLYDDYLEDPSSIPPQWREFFEKLPRVEGSIGPDVPHSVIRTHFRAARTQPAVTPRSSPCRRPSRTTSASRSGSSS